MLLPTNKASMLRGGFGNCFKKLVCANTISKICKQCPVRQQCTYTYIFETSSKTEVPRPYIIEVPFNDKRHFEKGEQIKFTILLLGKATTYLPYFIFAFIELGNKGLTLKKYKFKLSKVTDNNNNVVFDGRKIFKTDAILSWKDILNNNLTIKNDKLMLNFVTPLRLIEHRKLVSNINFNLLIDKLLQRINAIYKYHCDTKKVIDSEELLSLSNSINTSFNNLHWQDWERYSNRQKTKMLFGGLVGNIIFKGNFNEFLPYINLGSYIHIGKNCTFGQGKYDIL